MQQKTGRPSEADAVITLTPREKDVFHMLLRGMKAKDIAAEFSITIWGANYFIKQIYRKLNVNNKTQLILEYFDCRQTEDR
ncbi:MAG: helix-turn-helix transcriptional regulator [Clostridiales bacterium]|nr:helix-turn-helix transcriptional regulator [Clostridiales bacterium]